MKPDCYKCNYRGDLPGSAHSKCEHPAFEKAHNNDLGNIMSILTSVWRVAPIHAQGDGIIVKGNAHGIRHGWFNHPYNFDPIWLEDCSGYTPKDEGLQKTVEGMK